MASKNSKPTSDEMIVGGHNNQFGKTDDYERECRLPANSPYGDKVIGIDPMAIVPTGMNSISDTDAIRGYCVVDQPKRQDLPNPTGTPMNPWKPKGRK